MELLYSFIIPVFNRPDEVAELLLSFAKQDTSMAYEIVLIEDGSTQTCEATIARFPELNITYLYKDNSGPGSSRNYGMQRAKGNYFIILDSDCMLPPQYLRVVDAALQDKYVDFFGGPDSAHTSFSDLQKAINYSMTSFLTTGGLRGGGENSGKFQPRSFNMGLSKKAFEASGGFGDIHPGEDPDLVLRLWKLGYTSALIKEAFVYHKRRISWHTFYKQVYKFGLVRPILNQWHPESAKVTYWVPTLFLIGALLSSILALAGYPWPYLAGIFYLLLILIHASLINRSGKIALMSVFATCIQFYGYGKGFLLSTMYIRWFGALPRKRYPHLFFK